MKYQIVEKGDVCKRGDIRLDYSYMMLILGKGNVFVHNSNVRVGNFYKHGCKSNCRHVFRKTEKNVDN